MEKPQVNVFLVGVTKGGTTALYEYMRRHSQVCMSEPKETNYFSCHAHRGLSWYRETFFSGWRGEPLVGEASTPYLTLPWVAPRLAQSFPDARLIAILRCPVKRAFSHWWMQHRNGTETRSFALAIKESLEAYRKQPVLETYGAETMFSERLRALETGRPFAYHPYIESGHYAEGLLRLRKHFPTGRLLVLSNGELAKRPDLVMARVWTFLQVPDEAIALANARVHRARGPWGQKLNRWALMMRLDKVVPQDLVRWTRDALIAAGDRPPEPDRATLALLEEYYRPHNASLAALLGRSLDDPWDDGGVIL